MDNPLCLFSNIASVYFPVQIPAPWMLKVLAVFSASLMELVWLDDPADGIRTDLLTGDVTTSKWEP